VVAVHAGGGILVCKLLNRSVHAAMRKKRKQNHGPSIRDSAEAHGLAWAVDQLHWLKLKLRGRKFKNIPLFTKFSK
jgi:hypothetical protein